MERLGIIYILGIFINLTYLDGEEGRMREATIEALIEVLSIARMVVKSPPRSAQLVRLISKLKEKIEELDRI